MRYLGSFIAIIIVISLSQISGCISNITPSLNLQQKASKILQEGSPWGGTGNVEIISSPSGVDPSDLAGLQLSFETSGEDDWAPTFFEASGADDFLSTDNATWIWAGSGTDNITLTDASVSELTSVDVEDESITFSFEVNPSNSGGRITGIDGSYRVQMK